MDLVIAGCLAEWINGWMEGWICSYVQELMPNSLNRLDYDEAYWIIGGKGACLNE